MSKSQPAATHPPEMHPRLAGMIESVLDLFMEKGYHETSIRDIAAAANMNMATLYKYIADKHDLLFRVIEWNQANLGRDFVAALKLPGDCPTNDLHAYVTAWIDTCGRHSRSIRFSYRELASLTPQASDILGEVQKLHVAQVEEIVRRGIEAGEFKPVDPLVMASEIIFLGHFWALKSWSVLPKVGFKEVAETTVRFILDGISTQSRGDESGEPRANGAAKNSKAPHSTRVRTAK